VRVVKNEVIAIALDQLPMLTDDHTRKQNRELVQAMGMSPSESFALGFSLGLQTARVMISDCNAILQAGVAPEEIL